MTQSIAAAVVAVAAVEKKNHVVGIKKIKGVTWIRQGKENNTCKAEGSDGLCKNAEILNANDDIEAMGDVAIAA